MRQGLLTATLMAIVLLLQGVVLASEAPRGRRATNLAAADPNPLSVAEPEPGDYSGAVDSPIPLGNAATRYLAPGVAVGNTYHDQQHNGTIGRMIDRGWDATSNLVVHFSWIDLPGPLFLYRGYGYSSYHTVGDSIIAEAHIQPSDHYAGYVNLAVDGSNAAIVGGHEHSGDGQYVPQFYYDFCPAFGCFANFPNNRVPDSVMLYEANPSVDFVIWPHIRYHEIPGNDPVLHVFAQESMPEAADPQGLYYYRRVGDIMTGSWDYPPYVVDTTFNVAQDVAASKTGGKMALVWNANRCPDLSVCDTCSDNTGSIADYSRQLDNDIYYQVSYDYGASFEPRFNLTKNQSGVAGYRPYTDLSALITSDDALHIAWSGRVWDGQSGAIQACSMFHWDENLGFYPDGRGRIAKVADLEWEQTLCNGGAWQMNGSKISISECNGKLYYLWVQFNDIPAGVEDDCAQRGLDGTEFVGSGNGELYVSVSSDWGNTWDPSRNLTNTRTPGCDPAGAGERCYSEHWPSMAEFGSDHPHGASVSVVDPSGSYADNWYLDVQYVDDQDAGSIVKAEGSWTLNDMRWFRLACVDPVQAARLSVEPDNLGDAILIASGEQLDTILTLTNYGNTELNYTLSIAEITGPEGWLTTSGLESASLPPGPDSAITGTVHLNTGGIVTSDAELNGYLIFDGNFEGSPCSVEVECWVYDGSLPMCDTIYVDDGSKAHALALILGDDGNMGDRGRGTVNLDYFNYGDCDVFLPGEEDSYPGDASVYLYDGSPVICWEEGGTPVCEASIFDRSSFEGGFLPVAHTSEDTAPDWLPPLAGYWVGDFFTSTLSTRDSSIQIDCCTFAPDSPINPNWMVQAKRYTNLTGSDLTGLAIGEVIDWDIPSDSANWNNSGFDASRRLIYQIGSEFDQDEECQDNNLRYGGLAVVRQHDGYNWSDFGYGMYTMDNSTQIYPFEGLNDDSLWKYMEQNSGFLISDSADADLHSVATYQWNYALEADRELLVYTCLVTEKDGLAAFEAACDECLAYVDAIFVFPPPDCLLRGDIDHSGDGPNIADLVYLVSYMFSAGPEPPCMAAADVNGDEAGPDISDLVYLVSYMFSGGPPPVPCW